MKKVECENSIMKKVEVEFLVSQIMNTLYRYNETLSTPVDSETDAVVVIIKLSGVF